MGKTFKDQPQAKDNYSRFSDTSIRNQYQARRLDIDTSITYEPCL